MSWAQEEWKEGLSHKALGKIAEIEKQNEILKKETKQKQFMLESLEASNNKQKRKLDDDKVESGVLKRENHTLSEECTKLQQKVEKLSNDLRHKEVHINSLEGQFQRCKYQLEQYYSKTPKKGKCIEEKEREFSLKITELQTMLDQEKTKTKSLEKEINDMKHSVPKSAKKSSYVPASPWATDEAEETLVAITPVKKAPPVFDLLTSSPLLPAPLNAGGDSNLPILLPTLSQQVKTSQSTVTVPSVEPMNDNIESFQNELRLKSQEITSLKAQLEETIKKLRESEQKTKQMKEDVKSDREELEVSQAKIDGDHSNEIRKMKKMLQDVGDGGRRLEQQLAEAKKKFAQELSDAKNDLKQAQTELDQTSSNRNKLDSELKKTQHKLLQMEQLHQTDQSRIKQLQDSEQVLNKENALMAGQLERLTDKLDSSESQCSTFKSEIQRLQQASTGHKNELEQKQAESKKMKTDFEKSINQLENTVDKLKSESHDLDDRRLKLEACMKKKDQDISQLKDQVNRMENNSSGTFNKLEQRSNEVESLTKENNMLIEQSETVVAELKKTKSEIEKLKEIHENKVAAISKEHSKELEQLKMKIEDLQSCSQEEARRLALGSQEELKSISAKMKDQEDHLHQLNLRCEEKQRMLVENRKKLDEQLKFAEELRSNHSTLQQDYKRMQEEEDKLKDLVKKLENDFQNSVLRIKEISKSKEEVQEKHKALIQEARADSIERKSLEGRVQDLEAQIERMQEAVDVSEGHLRALEIAKNSENEARSDLSNLKMLQEKDASRIRDLEDEVKMLRSNIEITAFEKDENAAELSELTNSIKLKVTRYESSLESKDAFIKKMEESSSALLSERNSLVEEISALKKLLKEQACQQESTSTLVDRLNRECENKDVKIAEIHQALETQAHELSQVQKDLSFKQSELDNLSLVNQQLQEQLCNKSSTLETLQKEFDVVKTAKTGLDEKSQNALAGNESLVLSLQESVSTAEEKLSQQEDLLTKSTAVIEDLKEQNALIQKELEQRMKLVEECQITAAANLTEIRELKQSSAVLQQLMDDEAKEHEHKSKELSIALENSQGEASNFQNEVESLKLSLDVISSEKSKAVNLAEERLQEIATLQGRIGKQNLEFRQLEQVFVERSQEMDQKEIDFKNLKESSDNLRQTIATKEMEIKKMFEEYSEYRESSEALKESLNCEISNLNGTVVTLQSDLAKVENLETSLENARRTLEEKVITLEQELNKAIGNAELLQMDMDDKDELIAELETKSTHLQECLDNNRKASLEKEAEVLSLSAELNQKICELDGVNQSNGALNLQMLKCQSDLSVQMEHTSKLLLKVDETEKHKAELTTQLQSLEQLYHKQVEAGNQVVEQRKALQTKLEDQDEVICDLNMAAEKSSDTEEKLITDLDLATKQLGEKEKELTDMNASLKEAKSVAEDIQGTLKQERLEFKEEQQTLVKEMETLRKDFEMLMQNKEEVEKELEQTLSQYDNLDILCNRYMEDNASLREDTDKLNSELMRSSQTVVDLEMQIDDVEQKLEHVVQSNGDTIAKLEMHLEASGLEKHKIEEELKQVQQDSTAMTRRLDENTEVVSSLENRIENLMSSNLELSETITTKDKYYEKLSAEAESLRLQKVALDEMLNKTSTDLDQLKDMHQNKLESIESSLLESKEEMLMLQDELESSNSQLNSEVERRLLLETEVSSVKTNNENLLLKQAALENDLQVLNNQVKSLSTDKSELVKQCKIMEEKIEASAKEYSEFCAVLNEDIRKLTDQNFQLKQQVLDAENFKSDLQAKAMGLKENLEDLSDQLQKSNSDNETLKSKFIDAQSLVLSRDDKIGELTEENHLLMVKLQDKNEESAQAVCALKSEMKQRDHEHNQIVLELNTKIFTLEDAATELEECIADCRRQLEESKSNLDKVQIENQNLRDHLKSNTSNKTQLEKEFNDLRQEQSHLLEQLEQQSIINHNLDEKLSERQNEIVVLRSENQQLLQDFRNLETSLLDMKIALKNVEKERDTTVESLEQVIEDLRRSGEMAELKHIDELVSKKNELDCLNETCRDLTCQVETLQSTNNDTLQQCFRGKERISHLEEMLELKSEALSIKTEELSEVKAKLKLELEKNSEQRLAEMSNQIETLETQITNLNSLHESVLDENKANVKRAEQRYQALEQEFSVARQNFAAERALTETKDMMVSDLRKNIENLQSSLQETTQDYENIKFKLESLTKENKDLKLFHENSTSEFQTEVTKLEEALAKMENVRDNLKEQKNTLKEDFSELEKQLSETLLEENQLKSDLEAACQQNERLKKTVNDLEIQVSDSKPQLLVAIETIDKLQAEHRLHVDAMTLAERENKEVRLELEAHISGLKTEVEKSESKVDSKQQVVDTLKTQLDQTNFKLENLKEDYDVINNEFETLKNREQEYDRIIEEKSILEDKLQEMETQVRLKTEEIQEISEEKLTLQNEVTSLQGVVSKMQSDHHLVVTEIRTGNLELTKMLESVQLEVDEWKTKHQSMEEELNEKCEKVAGLLNQLASAESEISNLSTVIAELESTQNIHQQEYERLKEDHRQVVGELESTTRTLELEVRSLKEDLAATSGNLCTKETQLASAESEISNLSTVISELESTQNIHQQEYEQLKEDHRQVVCEFESKTQTLEEEVRSLNKNLLASSESLRIKENDLECCNLETEELRARLAIAVSTAAEFDAVKNKFSKAEDENRNLISEQEELEEELGRMRKQNEELNVDVGRLTTILEDKETELKMQREKLNLLENVVSEAETSNSQMSSELRKLNDAIKRESSSSRRRISSIEDENDQLRKKMSGMQVQLEEQRMHEQGWLQERRDKDHRIKSLEEEVTIMEEERAKLQAFNSKLKEDRSSMREELSKMKNDLLEAESNLRKMVADHEDEDRMIFIMKNEVEESRSALADLQASLLEERAKYEELEQSNAVSSVQLQEDNGQLQTKLCDITQKLADAERREKISESRLSELEAKSVRRDKELEAASRKAVNDFNLMKGEIEVLEASNTRLSMEVESYKVSDRISQSKLESALESIIESRSQLEEEIAAKEDFKREVEKMRSGHLVEADEELKRVREENLRLKKEVEKIKGKLHLMTSTARHKEKELIRYKEQHSGSSKPTSAAVGQSKHHVMSSHDSESSQSSASKPPTARCKSPRKNVGKPPQAKQGVFDEGTKKSRLSDETSGSTSPVYQLEGLPHLVRKGFADIPQGFASPHVMRRQHLTKTKLLVAEAMAGKKHPKHTTQDKPASASRSPAKNHLTSIKAQKKTGKSPSKALLEPPVSLKNITNSPKHSPGVTKPQNARKSVRKLSLSSTDEKPVTQTADDCKMQ